MHEISELGTGVPAFLVKLWKLVNDPDTNDLICWSDGGQSFLITCPSRFTQELLPMYYKHNNMASFIRQLNMYGFHKVVSVDGGGLRSEKDHMEFSHTCFIKGYPYLVENIKRKMPATHRVSDPILSYVKEVRGDAGGLSQGDLLSQVLSDVRDLKRKQSSWDKKLEAMKRENETLWRELAIFRQKHHKQEQIINKLIRFIVTMVQPAPRNVSLRRRFPLMLDDVKRTKSRPAASSTQTSGPTIRELDPAEFLLGETEAVPSADNKPLNREYVIPNLEEELPEEEYVSSTLISDHPYVVVSPNGGVDDPEKGQDLTVARSPWLHLDLSDTDADAMTPINPAKVNPQMAPRGRKRAAPVEQEGPSLLSAKPSKVQKVKKTVIPVTVPAGWKLNGAKKRRKSAKPKKASNTYSQPVSIVAIESVPENDFTVPIKIEVPTLEGNESENEEISNFQLSPAPEAQAIPEMAMLPEDLGAETLDPTSLALVRPNTGFCADEVTRDLGNHVDSMQGDIEFLKEFLKGDSCSLDASTLLELFNDDPLAYNMPPIPDEKTSKDDDVAGNELMTYGQPNLLDLVDLYGGTGSIPPPESPSSVLNTPISTPLSPNFPSTPSGRKHRK